MTTYYSGKGDHGDTGLIGKIGVRKSSKIIDAIGNLDELNCAIGLSIASISGRESKLLSSLRTIQNDIFIMGAELSYYKKERKFIKKIIEESDIGKLENYIADFSSKLPELKNFVLPGGSETGAFLHLARAISRRAERRMVDLSDQEKVNIQSIRYLNRLSSFLFVAALYINRKRSVKELHPFFG